MTIKKKIIKNYFIQQILAVSINQITAFIDLRNLKDHYYLFRLKSLEEIENLGLFENNKNLITLIEWPQIIKKKPKNLIELNFKYEDDHKKRSAQIKGLNL